MIHSASYAQYYYIQSIKSKHDFLLNMYMFSLIFGQMIKLCTNRIKSRIWPCGSKQFFLVTAGLVFIATISLPFFWLNGGSFFFQLIVQTFICQMLMIYVMYFTFYLSLYYQFYVQMFRELVALISTHHINVFICHMSLYMIYDSLNYGL